jgi:type I restriction enzyme S subunit
MAVRGDGSTATRIGLVDSDNLIGANISPNLLRFKAKSRIMHPLFLYHFLVSEGGQHLLDRYVTRTAKKTITAQDIKEIRVPIPAYSLQEVFVQIAQQHEQTRRQQTESARQSAHLFQTLLHRAFQGEL